MLHLSYSFYFNLLRSLTVAKDTYNHARDAYCLAGDTCDQERDAYNNNSVDKISCWLINFLVLIRANFNPLLDCQ